MRSFPRDGDPETALSIYLRGKDNAGASLGPRPCESVAAAEPPAGGGKHFHLTNVPALIARLSTTIDSLICVSVAIRYLTQVPQEIYAEDQEIRKRKITVMIRVKEDGEWIRKPALYGKRGKIRPGCVMIEGEERTFDVDQCK